MRLACLSALVFGVLTSVLVADALPKVLILADGVHLGTARMAAGELKGRATVTVPAEGTGNTGTALGLLDEVLGDTKWDLIHFNFGFADLRHLDPKTKSVRVMSRHTGGERVTGPKEYEANLGQIVARLKATKAKLIWAHSTPLVGTKYDHVYESGSEIGYNSIAARIMTENGIAINDMHAWVLANVKKFSNPFSFRGIAIQQPVVESIEKALGLPAKKVSEKK